VKRDSLSYHIIIGLLRVALVLSLTWACWAIYRNLSTDGGAVPHRTQSSAQTMLAIRLSPSQLLEGQSLEIPVELYPIDLTAVQHEYYSERRAGVRFEDFLQKKLNGRQTLQAKLDRDGGGALMVPEGSWWIYATLNGPVTTEWRVPLNVSGARQQIDLTSANEYMRWKSF
jgi:hypothetical protein